MTERETMEYDVVIVGGGPAGLSAAIRLRQLSAQSGNDIRVCVLEKGSEIGAHILSGAVLEPRALNELIPDWKEKGAPLNSPAKSEEFQLLTAKKAISLITPPQMRNHGNYIISLGLFTRWLGQQAEALGVEIFAGFPAADLLMEEGRVAGVIVGDFGRDRDGSEKPGFQPGIAIKAKYTLLGEGCRGSLSQRVMQQFNLREGKSPQTYAIGIKELWEVDSAKHRAGHIVHTVGWPLNTETYGGSFIYHLENNQVAIGYVIGLDYTNPHLDPFMEFQRFKTHTAIRPLLEGGRRISYGARALNEGGYQSIPTLVFPGGALIGDSAGFLNVPKIKGTHTAMKSGMLAAEAIAEALTRNYEPLLADYPVALDNSWVMEELHRERNIRPSFHWGMWVGLLYSAIDTLILHGKAPWTFRHKADHTRLRKAADAPKIAYPRPDGVVSFDRMSSVYLSNTNHEEHQPCHLVLKDKSVPTEINLPLYDAPEQRYCPAGVYEIVRENDTPRLQINAQNCVHCKTCDIKDPTQNIVWVPPEGGGGPNYPNM